MDADRDRLRAAQRKFKQAQSDHSTALDKFNQTCLDWGWVEQMPSEDLSLDKQIAEYDSLNQNREDLKRQLRLDPLYNRLLSAQLDLCETALDILVKEGRLPHVCGIVTGLILEDKLDAFVKACSQEFV